LRRFNKFSGNFMPEIQVRPTVASDLPRLMGFDHSTNSESVWQLELRRDAGQSTAIFREVRLPRPITVSYPRNPFALADDWAKRSMMYTALLDQDLAGYTCLVERGMDSLVYVTDLVVNAASRRRGLGSALLSAAQEWSAGRGYRRVIFETQSKNLPAIRLVQKFGYEFCGYNDQHYLTQDVMLFFCKSLKA
jgi:ribosomal protein S18 acetylase RimI-like enzyme